MNWPQHIGAIFSVRRRGDSGVRVTRGPPSCIFVWGQDNHVSVGETTQGSQDPPKVSAMGWLNKGCINGLDPVAGILATACSETRCCVLFSRYESSGSPENTSACLVRLRGSAK